MVLIKWKRLLDSSLNNYDIKYNWWWDNFFALNVNSIVQIFANFINIQLPQLYIKDS